MKKLSKQKFEKLRGKLFEPLSDDMLSRIKGGGTTTNSMPTYNPSCGCTQTDTVVSNDGGGGPIST